MNKLIRNGDRVFNVIYSLGASIVILGVVGKLSYLPWGDYLLYIGLIVEAFIFFLSAFYDPSSKKGALLKENDLINKKEDQIDQKQSNPLLNQEIKNQETQDYDRLNKALFNELNYMLETTIALHGHIEDLSKKINTLNQIYSDILFSIEKNTRSNPTYHASEDTRKNDCPDLSSSYCYDGAKYRK